MTKQEMLAEVEAKIRKDIPRLLELREGCIIELDNVQAKIVLSNYEFENGCTHLLRNEERLWYATDEDLKHSKIIGHDITLSDVLGWLNSKNKNIAICSDGTLFELNNAIFYKKVGIYDYGIIKWDLSKLLLKDQSEELIKLLCDLKQKKDE